MNREVTQALLDEVGLAGECAHDGLEAVERFAACELDLVPMYLQMPRLGGVEATRRIRALHSGDSVPISAMTAMTASAFVEDRRRCLEAGMDAFITKPMEPDRLCEALLHWLSRDRMPA